MAPVIHPPGRHSDYPRGGKSCAGSFGGDIARHTQIRRSWSTSRIHCSGAFVLAATGALDGLRATTHWQAATELQRRFPEIDVDPDVLYVDNGTILTSAGAAAAFDLCLHLVRRDLGAEAAAAIARASVMPLERSGGQAQFIVHEPPTNDGTSIGRLMIWIEQNLCEDLSLPALARKAAMSVRTLSRNFRAQAGMTPAEWIARTRVRRAQRLLETTRLDVEQVAADCGFGSASVLRQHFAAVAGTSPVAYRRAFSRPLASLAKCSHSRIHGR